MMQTVVDTVTVTAEGVMVTAMVQQMQKLHPAAAAITHTRTPLPIISIIITVTTHTVISIFLKMVTSHRQTAAVVRHPPTHWPVVGPGVPAVMAPDRMQDPKRRSMSCHPSR